MCFNASAFSLACVVFTTMDDTILLMSLGVLGVTIVLLILKRPSTASKSLKAPRDRAFGGDQLGNLFLRCLTFSLERVDTGRL